MSSRRKSKHAIPEMPKRAVDAMDRIHPAPIGELTSQEYRRSYGSGLRAQQPIQIDREDRVSEFTKTSEQLPEPGVQVRFIVRGLPRQYVGVLSQDQFNFSTADGGKHFPVSGVDRWAPVITQSEVPQ